MRDTEARGWMVQNSSSAATRAMRFRIIASTLTLGIALAMTAGAARAADDEDNRGFSDKIIDSIKTTIRGGGNIDDGRIQYRERSPLVVPPKLDLPPPDKAPATEVKAPNWPKDPDEGRRRASAKKKKEEPGVFDNYFGSFLPTKPGAVATAAPEEPQGPPPPARPDNFTDKDNPVYDRAGNLWGGVGSFFGSKKTEVVQFKGEPTRESLTQPPAGYQTPSPNFVYGANIKTEVPRPVEVNSAGERVR
jgi:hypothetical protein